MKKTAARSKSDQVSKTRCNTFLLVLENPTNVENLASVIRCAEGHGIAKVYVITACEKLTEYLKSHKPGRLSSATATKSRVDGSSTSKNRVAHSMGRIAMSAEKWVYMRHFSTTAACVEHLAKNKWASVVTSPHIQDKTNMDLTTADFTKFKKLAVWMGNEGHGITDEAVAGSCAALQIPMWGRVESFNLACASAMIMYEVVKQRRAFHNESINQSVKQ